VVRPDGKTSARTDSLFSALPQTAHSALTPLGEIEQATKLADGFGRPREGWRRGVFRAGVIFLSLVALTLLILAVYSNLEH
jgi:hypothetical protein